MKFRNLVFINALLGAVAMASLVFYFSQSWPSAFITLALALGLGFLVSNYFFGRYINKKIILIYKLIHHLKRGKDIKNAQSNKISDDPIRDIEEEVESWAKEKAKEIDTLKEQEKFRREFLTNISHEFKTPLFAIQGYVDALQEGLMEEDPKLAIQFLDKAGKNLDRLTYLIQDLDEISKLESGRWPINFKPFDLVALINEVLESVEDRASKNQITLVFKSKYQIPNQVLADREKISQVLYNLLDNSFKYGQPKGHTYIRIYELFEQVLVEVTDDGIGIEEKSLSRVFERFYRADKSRSRMIGGSGLGLAIVKHIIEAHDQAITVRSTEGLGTTFAFTLEKAKN